MWLCIIIFHEFYKKLNRNSVHNWMKIWKHVKLGTTCSLSHVLKVGQKDATMMIVKRILTINVICSHHVCQESQQICHECIIITSKNNTFDSFVYINIVDWKVVEEHKHTNALNIEWGKHNWWQQEMPHSAKFFTICGCYSSLEKWEKFMHWLIIFHMYTWTLVALQCVGMWWCGQERYPRAAEVIQFSRM